MVLRAAVFRSFLARVRARPRGGYRPYLRGSFLARVRAPSGAPAQIP
jgi:hypothetical protein